LATETVRTFDTGASRSNDAGKPDYEGYLSPQVLVAFGKYMTKHRQLPDGTTRASDNWQKGIPRDAYMKSLWRHFVDLWVLHRGGSPVDPITGEPVTLEDSLMALLFNVQGYAHEALKVQAPTVDRPRYYKGRGGYWKKVPGDPVWYYRTGSRRWTPDYDRDPHSPLPGDRPEVSADEAEPK
jgi:hypothetical protein